MQLELAIVQSCSAVGCLVRLLDSGDSARAAFSPAITQYQIRIIPDQLVIVNRAIDPPQIVWRWTRATVTRLAADHVELLHDDGRHLRARLSPDFDGPLHAGATVFLTGFHDDNWMVVDTATNGAPAHPERLKAALYPTIHP